MLVSKNIETKISLSGDGIEKLAKSLSSLQEYVNTHRDAFQKLIDTQVNKTKVPIHKIDDILNRITEAINATQYLKSDEPHDIRNEEGAVHKIYKLISHLYHPLKVLRTKDPNIHKIVKELHTITVLFHDILAREIDEEEMFHIYLRQQSKDLEKTLADMGKD